MRVLLAALVLSLTLSTGVQPPLAFAAGAKFCAAGQAAIFVQGFAALKRQVGDSMGEPLECQHVDAKSGDTVQATSLGLAYYGRASNIPAFTDGFQRWALTAEGLVAWTGDSPTPPTGAPGSPPEQVTTDVPAEPVATVANAPSPADAKVPAPAAHTGSPTPGSPVANASTGPSTAASVPAGYCPQAMKPAFSQGLAALADILGQQMGNPLECEHADGTTGHTAQTTTSGLAYYDATTNMPAFTDGWQHWALVDGAVTQWTGPSPTPPEPTPVPALSIAATAPATVDEPSAVVTDALTGADATVPVSADSPIPSEPTAARVIPEAALASSPAGDVAPLELSGGPTPPDRPGARVGLKFAPGRDPLSVLQWRNLPDGTLWLGVPFVSQIDGSQLQFARGGPAALSMALTGLGANTVPGDVTNRLSPTVRDAESSTATTLDDLARVGRELGAVTEAVQRPLSLDGIRDQVAQGNAVITLVNYNPLDGASPTTSDHFVVLSGLTPTGFIYNDPAFASRIGYGLEISSADFAAAQAATETPGGAIAIVSTATPVEQPVLAAASQAAAAEPIALAAGAGSASLFSIQPARGAMSRPVASKDRQQLGPDADAPVPVGQAPGEQPARGGQDGLGVAEALALAGLILAVLLVKRHHPLPSSSDVSQLLAALALRGRPRGAGATATFVVAAGLVVASYAGTTRADAASHRSIPNRLPSWVQTTEVAPLLVGPGSGAAEVTRLPTWSFLRVRGVQGARLLVEYAGDGALSEPALGWVALRGVMPSDPGGAWLQTSRETTLFADAAGARPAGQLPPETLLRPVGADATEPRVLVRTYSPDLTSVSGEGWVELADVATQRSPAQSVQTSDASATSLGAQLAPEKFIQAVGEAARTSQALTGVPASVTVAQAVLESDWGTSLLTQDAKNYFGIKAGGAIGSDGLVWMPTLEYQDNQPITVTAAFRAYASLADSVADHGWLLRNLPRYAAAFATTDPAEFARRLQDGGYSTDPAYAAKLIQLMDAYRLWRFDA